MKEILEKIITKATLLGLPSTDVDNAQEFLEHHEFGLCFDTIITQLYEYDIEIDKEFFHLIVKVAKKLDIPNENIGFIKKLLR